VSFAAHALHGKPEFCTRVATDPAFTLAFVHELRRFYPFVPLLGARARHDLAIGGDEIPTRGLLVLDVFGHLHDPHWWRQPNRFDPARFLGFEVDPFTLIPQGGGDVRTGHRCPGEDITVAALCGLVARLAAMTYEMRTPVDQVPLHRIPALPKGGTVIRRVKLPV
jgi:fatty-acid peroxygenase